MPHISLDSRYKTRIPWRTVLEIPSNQDIPHGRRDFNASTVARRRQAKAEQKADALKQRIEKARADPWRFSDQRFFPDRIFLEKINNSEIVALPLERLSSINPNKTHRLSIVGNTYNRTKASKSTITQVGPGAYLRHGNRSVLRLQPMPVPVLKQSVSFTLIERPEDVFGHMRTFEKEKAIEENKKYLMQELNKKINKSAIPPPPKNKTANVLKMPVTAMKSSKSTSHMPLNRALDWYDRYGKNASIKDKCASRKRKMLYHREKKKKQKQTIKQGFGGGGGEEADEVMKRRKRYEKQVIPASIDYLKEVKVLLNRKNKMIDRRNLEKYSGKRKESSPLKKGGGIFSRDVLNV